MMTAHTHVRCEEMEGHLRKRAKRLPQHLAHDKDVANVCYFCFQNNFSVGKGKVGDFSF